MTVLAHCPLPHFMTHNKFLDYLQIHQTKATSDFAVHSLWDDVWLSLLFMDAFYNIYLVIQTRWRNNKNIFIASYRNNNNISKTRHADGRILNCVIMLCEMI